jgi:hypothetical protein
MKISSRRDDTRLGDWLELDRGHKCVTDEKREATKGAENWGKTKTNGPFFGQQKGSKKGRDLYIYDKIRRDGTAGDFFADF